MSDFPKHDEEHALQNLAPDATTSKPQHRNHRSRIASRLARCSAWVEGLAGFEARGIRRVAPDERHAPSLSHDVQVFLLWLSANLSLNNLGAGLLGPMLLGLGFRDAAACAVLGAFFGSLSTAYMCTFGPQSGNRTMVALRFLMGYWPAKIPCLLNIILMIGYCTIDAIIAGQVLSAVSGNGMSIAVGVVVISAVCWMIAAFGMYPFQIYERYAWLPQVIVLAVLIGCAGPYFDAAAPNTVSGTKLAAARLTYFSLCSYVPNSWSAAAADFYVYYPERTPRRRIFLLTLAGLWISFSLVYMVAIGLATGTAHRPAWAQANDISTGALVVAAFAPLGGFGSVCSVVMALGVVANSVPGTYSSSLGCQTLGRYGKAVPRWVWSSVLVLIQLVLGLAGRRSLFDIYSNFVALMGYWIEFMVCICLQEQLIFRRGRGWDWAQWENKAYLPQGWAALVSFLVGWVGAVIGMSQAWYVGPVSKLADGADLGMWIGFGMTMVTFPPLRYLELKHIGR
ncbi:Permease, cytosine/purines, uracil, thiamine, allantoin [Cordyceps fumosorosea ARSEF 2679]|uniref:Permease, cytosine/purines, uracil, thiamine, allantoin n=1 Tax=Cordyceps fumosorosea (strain ARSEF 2679) TaxID=1081104 RepID=A0A167LCQ6_CORFA|nr:Permease, cytosine/purines, uracil, thiamine, allantoin [Cordyceps fumosorosea ARSEF 2679]OAA52934.1 Permease, cytosine/purines, uracil, thiamine, allantoin [Cordyceps fumosorosea ARSEF 2679]